MAMTVFLIICFLYKVKIKTQSLQAINTIPVHLQQPCTESRQQCISSRKAVDEVSHNLRYKVPLLSAVPAREGSHISVCLIRTFGIKADHLHLDDRIHRASLFMEYSKPALTIFLLLLMQHVNTRLSCFWPQMMSCNMDYQMAGPNDTHSFIRNQADTKAEQKQEEG
jgi:hypothetical protein